MMSTHNIYQYGSMLPLPKAIPLRAGPLSLILEDGDLRYIRLNDREVVRRIYVGVRDHNWGTVPPQYTNKIVRQDANTFEITYDVLNSDSVLGIDYVWQGMIRGDRSGTITFEMVGNARTTFLSNRIGFCVLHPLKECTGETCIIEKVDGSNEHTHFPVAIVPQQPFTNIRAITHEILPGLLASVRFFGETFEMEDQRAWIDASFKTYCTPLSIPFPREISAGTVIRQSVTLTLHGDVAAYPAVAAEDAKPIVISLLDVSTVPVPRIGLGSASHGRKLIEHEIARLRLLNLSHLRVDLQPSRDDIVSKLTHASDESLQLGIPLEVALFLSENAEAELQSLTTVISTIRPKIWAWLILPAGLKSTTENLIRLAHSYLGSYDSSAQFGGGTNVYFTELNRDRPSNGTLDRLDFVSYSVNPQVHAFDNRSLAETCEALPFTLASTRQFVGDKGIGISPITLKPRFNAVATGPEPETAVGELPRQVDPRQMSLFGAAWTLCSFKYLAESGLVQHITYYETTGWQGVMETSQGAPLPSKFPSVPGSVFPLYYVLADLGEIVGGSIHPIVSDAPLSVDGLLIEKNGRSLLLLANWTAEEQSIRIAFGQIDSIRILDGDNVEFSCRAPEHFREFKDLANQNELKLTPFATVRIDLH